MEKNTVITIGLVITVYLFLLMLLLIAMVLFRGESKLSHLLRYYGLVRL